MRRRWRDDGGVRYDVGSAGPVRDADRGRDGGHLDAHVPFPKDSVQTGRKRVAVISQGQSSVLSAAYARWQSEAAQAAGWEVSPILDAQLDPSKMAAFIQQAVEAKYDGIMYGATDPHALTAALNAAAAANIPVACIACSDQDFEGKLVTAKISEKAVGEAIGAYIVSKSQGKAHVLQFPDADVPHGGQANAVHYRLPDQELPRLRRRDDAVHAGERLQAGSAGVHGGVGVHPVGSVTDVIAPYGTAAVAFAKTAQSASRTELRISSIDSTSDLILQVSQKALPLGAAPVWPQEFLAWTTADLLARKMAGAALYDSQDYSVGLVDADNAEQFLPAGVLQPPALDYKAKFKELWKQQPDGS
jgi:hypothetical protein